MYVLTLSACPNGSQITNTVLVSSSRKQEFDSRRPEMVFVWLFIGGATASFYLIDLNAVVVDVLNSWQIQVQVPNLKTTPGDI